MQFTYSKGIGLCGIIWGFVGYKLVSKGIIYFAQAQSLGLLTQEMIGIWVGVSLLIGFLKGKFILTKSADRVIRHIVSQEEPLILKRFLPKSFLIVMMSMMFLGISLRYIGIPLMIKGVIDISVGTALIFGAFHFVKKATMIYLALKKI